MNTKSILIWTRFARKCYSTDKMIMIKSFYKLTTYYYFLLYIFITVCNLNLCYFLLLNYFIDFIYAWLNLYLYDWYQCYLSDDLGDKIFRVSLYCLVSFAIGVRHYPHQKLVRCLHCLTYFHTGLSIFLSCLTLDIYFYTANIMYLNYLWILYWDKCGRYTTWWIYYYFLLNLDFLLELYILYFALCFYTTIDAIRLSFKFLCWSRRNFFYYTIKYIYKPLRPYIIYKYK